MHLVLLDIDGTLLRTGGAGRESLDEAFLACFGWEDATRGVYIAGSTDGAILRDVAARLGPFDEEALRAAYLVALERRVAVPGRVELCPGVQGLLDALDGRAHLGLLTGNWRAGASVKLRAAGLDIFSFGAYGDDAIDRNALVPIARSRAPAHDRVIVIGDTPADVRCARAGGAFAVAVETGFATPEELAQAGPDLQIPDLLKGTGWVVALSTPPSEVPCSSSVSMS